MADQFVVVGDLGDEIGPKGVAEQVGDDADGTRRVEHVNDGGVVIGRDLDRRMRLRRGRAADQQRHVEALAFHLGGDRAHFVQGRRNQAGQADQVGVLVPGRLQNIDIGHHDSQIDDLEVVALKHDADDFLADVVDVALDRGHDDLALALGLGILLGLQERLQIGHRLFHDPGAFNHLGQEHLPRAEQVADHVHAVHQRPFDDLDGALCRLADFLGVHFDEIRNAIDQRVLQPLGNGGPAPTQVVGFLADLAFGLIGDLQQPFGVVGPAVEDRVLDAFSQLVGQIPVDRQLAGVDDGHVEAAFDGVIEEHRVHGLAHRVVAAKRERHVG